MKEAERRRPPARAPRKGKETAAPLSGGLLLSARKGVRHGMV